MNPPSCVDFPLRFETVDPRPVRDLLRESGFEETTLCRLFGIEDMSGLGSVKWEKAQLDAVPARLRLFVDVFLRGRAIDAALFQNAVGAEMASAFQGLGLVRRHRVNPGLLVSPVWLYPVAGFVVASDRRDDPEGGGFAPPPDVVFPAIYGGTLRFLRMLPKTSGDALDLCGGTGIGALCFSRSSRSAVTSDITSRAQLFAEFNGRLNGARIESLQGDLFEPVNGRKFDIIAAHPPFVPAVGEHMVYRDAGETGEDITRRIVEALPAYLRPGGYAVIVCVARDTDRLGFEKRAAGWLGATAAECEIVFGVEKLLSVSEVIESMRRRGENFNTEQADRLRSRLEAAHTSQFAYGTLFLRRNPGPPQSIAPLRVRITPQCNAADLLRLLEWRQKARSPEFLGALAAARPKLAPKLELNVRHLNCDGELTPAEVVFSVSGAFEAAIKPDAWVAPLIARLNGKLSVREVYDQAAAADELPAGFPFEAFADLVRIMVERSLLEA